MLKLKVVATGFFSFRMPKLKLAGENVALTVAACARSTRPAPIDNRPALIVLADVVETPVIAELINADISFAGTQSGCCWLVSAADPATVGGARLVPGSAMKT